VKRALKALNLEPVGTATVERNTVDVAAAIKTLVPLQPQAIVQISAYRSCAAFIREARKAGYGGQFYNVSFVGTQALADELKADGRGVMISQVMPFPHSPTLPIVREYLEAVKKAGGDHTANFSSIEGYVAARVFCDGLKRAGRNASREALINALESINSMNLGGFNVSFGAKDRVASRFVDLSMLTGDGRVTR
jgi:ABC-type branched-subunit amino acid transport system substrate-binding protein